MVAFVTKVILGAIAGSLLLVCPRAHSSGWNEYASTATRCLALELAFWAFWTVFVYPKFFSPLRQLPRPKVKFPFESIVFIY